MNIYLDIDGVIKGVASPIEDLEEWLNYILEHYPNSTYWLTTHCKGGENNAKFALTGVISEPLLTRLCETVQPTDWRELKTDAIDFSKDFIWFDDDVFESESVILEQHEAEDRQFMMDPFEPTMAKRALAFLKEHEKQNALTKKVGERELTLKVKSTAKIVVFRLKREILKNSTNHSWTISICVSVHLVRS